MRLPFAGLLVLSALLMPRSGHGQSIDDLYPGARMAAAAPVRFDTVAPVISIGVQPESRGEPAGVLALGGLVGGAAGLALGIYTGNKLAPNSDDDCYEWCIPTGAIYGGLAGEILGIALGVHLSNDRRGSLPMDLLASAGILTVGFLAALEEGSIILVIPVAQIVGTVAAERGTEPQN